VSASTESAFGSEALRRFGAVEDMIMTMPALRQITKHQSK
jgi:hypothetical protein